VRCCLVSLFCGLTLRNTLLVFRGGNAGRLLVCATLLIVLLIKLLFFGFLPGRGSMRISFPFFVICIVGHSKHHSSIIVVLPAIFFNCCSVCINLAVFTFCSCGAGRSW